MADSWVIPLAEAPCPACSAKGFVYNSGRLDVATRDDKLGCFPGNGTRYTAVAIPWQGREDLLMGALGVVSHGWLVISGNSGQAYLFQNHGSLTDRYIQEKLGSFRGDYPHFGDLIRQIIDRPNIEKNAPTS